jgi:hypothetical protein
MAAPERNNPATARNDPTLITKSLGPVCAQGGKRDFHYMGNPRLGLSMKDLARLETDGRGGHCEACGIAVRPAGCVTVRPSN